MIFLKKDIRPHPLLGAFLANIAPWVSVPIFYEKIFYEKRSGA